MISLQIIVFGHPSRTTAIREKLEECLCGTPHTRRARLYWCQHSAAGRVRCQDFCIFPGKILLNDDRNPEKGIGKNL